MMWCVVKVIRGLDSIAFFYLETEKYQDQANIYHFGSTLIDGSPAIAFMEPEG